MIPRIIRALSIAMLIGGAPFCIVAIPMISSLTQFMWLVLLPLLTGAIFLGLPMFFTLNLLGLRNKYIYLGSGALLGIIIYPAIGIVNLIMGGSINEWTGIFWPVSPIASIAFLPFSTLSALIMSSVFYNVYFYNKISIKDKTWRENNV